MESRGGQAIVLYVSLTVEISQVTVVMGLLQADLSGANVFNVYNGSFPDYYRSYFPHRTIE